MRKNKDYYTTHLCLLKPENISYEQSGFNCMQNFQTDTANKLAENCIKIYLSTDIQRIIFSVRGFVRHFYMSGIWRGQANERRNNIEL